VKFPLRVTQTQTPVQSSLRDFKVFFRDIVFRSFFFPNHRWKNKHLMDVQSLPDFDVVMSLWYGGAAVSWEVVLKLNRGKCMSNMLGFGQLTAGENNKTTTSIEPENIPTHFPSDLPCLPCSVFVEFMCSERLKGRGGL